MFSLEDITNQSYAAASELLRVANVQKGAIMAVGCSSSEICGGVIGHFSSPETADAVFEGLSKAAEEFGIYIAAQCCEHLNRAIVVEREAVRLQLEAGVISSVNAVPQPKAGGSFASCAYRSVCTSRTSWFRCASRSIISVMPYWSPPAPAQNL